MKPYVVFDIETYKNDRAEEYIDQKEIKPDARLKDPVKIAADIAEKKANKLRQAALSPITGRITCMGLSYNGNMQFFIDKNEATLLREIDIFLSGKEIGAYVGHNSVGFDLPYLRVRHLANGIHMPSWLQPECRHQDTMLMIDRRNMVGLSDIEWLLDINRDSEKDGKAALKYWEDDDWESLKQYNLDDVRTTETLYLKLIGEA